MHPADARDVPQSLHGVAHDADLGFGRVEPENRYFGDRQAAASGEIENLDVPRETFDAGVTEELARDVAAEELEAALGVADAGHGEKLDEPVAGAAQEHAMEGLPLSDALSAGGWDAPFDVVVCADVLEHLPRPEELLEQIRGWLAPGGTLLVSLPNVANVTVRAGLLLGRFPYAEKGILDRTHLRFYTRRSARELLERAGFRIRSVDATAMPYELAISAFGRPPLSGPVRAFASGTARLWPTMFGYQFVIESERA